MDGAQWRPRTASIDWSSRARSSILSVRHSPATVSKMSTNTVRTRESPATHRPERYRASLPRASALSKSIDQIDQVVQVFHGPVIYTYDPETISAQPPATAWRCLVFR